ncbi:MAG: DUF4440 domain-containing protein [Chitinophagaceae bacterium]
MNYFKLAVAAVAFSCFAIGCNDKATDKTEATNKATDAPAPVAVKPDLATMKADIQALESAWATADNARDTNAVAAFYAKDAISLVSNKPMLVGKAAIQQDIANTLGKKRVKGSTVSYDVMDVFGDGNIVTEVGKTTIKDASGKVTYTGKYMAVWEKRDGKYICVRDIGNDDVKEK